MKTKIFFNVTSFLVLSLLLLIQLACKKESEEDPAPTPTPPTTTITDPRDGQIYKTITVDSMVWFAENLNYETPGSWQVNIKSSNGNNYGRLYTFVAAQHACPEGWHLSSFNNWKGLLMHLGMGSEEAGALAGWQGTDEGKKLKSTSGWIYDGNGTNEIGFNALPAGAVSGDGVFEDQGVEASWWTSRFQFENTVYCRHLLWGRDDVRSGPSTFTSGSGRSVRCVRDIPNKYFILCNYE
jgi:uncharacterized protein (TIGR02145 family)